VRWEKEEKQRSSTELLSECGSVEEEKRGFLNKLSIESEANILQEFNILKNEPSFF